MADIRIFETPVIITPRGDSISRQISIISLYLEKLLPAVDDIHFLISFSICQSDITFNYGGIGIKSLSPNYSTRRVVGCAEGLDAHRRNVSNLWLPQLSVAAVPAKYMQKSSRFLPSYPAMLGSRLRQRFLASPR